MSMIGYGDFYPSSYIGRVTATVGWFIGAVAFSLILLFAEKQSNFTRSQSNAFSSIFQTSAAAKVIQVAMKYCVCKKKYGPNHYISSQTYDELSISIIGFKKKKRELTELIMQKEQMLAEMKRHIKILETRMTQMERLYVRLSKHLRVKIRRLKENNKL